MRDYNDDEEEDDGTIVFVDTNSGDMLVFPERGIMPVIGPYLVFNRTDGFIGIADEPDTDNDCSARSFILGRDDAITFAIQLLIYARDGYTSHHRSPMGRDIERWFADKLRDNKDV